ncbi:MAG: hypothetical protein IH905_14265 [Proteobacteria bacterium]|nr:hypothetical protein [Pseudomonadota bacterium]
MSDSEHMNGQYLWRTTKHAQRAHIQNPETGRAYCQVEKCGGKPFDGRGADIPDGRRLCQNCADLAGRSEADYREPDIRVLLGERMAETESELFYEGRGKSDVDDRFGHVSTVVPESRKRKKQVWPAHRSKARKPKRSNVKYLRPFNDDLPW